MKAHCRIAPLIFILFVIFASSAAFGQADSSLVFFTIRNGQGGFYDSRSEIGKLGGGQLTLDVRYHKWPLALSLSGEYYTNSPEPTHRYEISDMIVLNLLYWDKPFPISWLTLFGGMGGGWLAVPKSEDNFEEYYEAPVFNIEAGLHADVYWKFGFYTIYKYLYSNWDVDGEKVIDFNEHIMMIGISFTFGLF